MSLVLHTWNLHVYVTHTQTMCYKIDPASHTGCFIHLLLERVIHYCERLTSFPNRHRSCPLSLSEHPSFCGQAAPPSSTAIALFSLFEGLCSLSVPLTVRPLPLQSPPHEGAARGRARLWKQALAGAQGLVFFAVFAPWHFSQILLCFHQNE